jgi:hypothetical protein
MKLVSFALIFCLLLPIVLAYPIEKYNIEKGKGPKLLEDKIPDLPNKLKNKGGIITSWFLKGLGRLTGGMSNKPKQNEIQNEAATGMFMIGMSRLPAYMPPDKLKKKENKGGMIYDWFLKGLRRLTGGMSDKTVVIEKYEKCTRDFCSMAKKERREYIEKILTGKLGSKDKLWQEVKQKEKFAEEASRQESLNKQKNDKENYSKI